jgi:hypothetical protein
MLDENQMVHPGRSGDDGDAALDAALAAADDDMLSAISDGLDLDLGLARILGDLGGSSAARPGIQPPAYPGEDRRIPDVPSRNPSSRIHGQGADAASPARVAVLIRDVNASEEAAEDQCLRARQAAGIAARSEHAASQAAARAREAQAAHLAIQAGHPRRRAPLPRQVTFALGTVILNGLACYFAAQALGGSLDAALVWTGLFLAVLAGGEVALGFCRDRGERAWRVLAVLIGLFVVLLGTLGFWFLAATGTGGLVPAIAGACLLTVTTAGFLTAGYRVLQSAETPSAYRARRQAGTAGQAARLARAAADRAAAERDRLIDAYLGHVRRLALKTSPPGRQLAVESAVRQHLRGELPVGEKADPASAADPGALASSRAGLPVPGGQAAAIITMRARARALACALARAHTRACALRFAVRGLGRPVPVLGRASAIDRALGCDLTRALLQARDVTRDLVRARDLARDLTRASAGDRTFEAGHAIDLDRTVDLADDLARDLALARGPSLTRDLAAARNLARGRARDRAYALARGLQEAVGWAEELVGRSHEGEIDASGANLSALDLTDISVLVGVVWTAETAWPPGIADQVRARSREIRPGVYRVCGGSERDPSELVRP